jgi:Alkylmercury lyase
MDTEQELNALDKTVRYHLYDYVMREGILPTVEETSNTLSRSSDEIKAAFQRLADGHILVLQKGSGEILMANPFSAVPTPFLVKANDRSYYGNCIWDAMGIPAMLRQDALVAASCGCCGRAMNLKITRGLLEETPGIAHFAIPAAHWWDDIVFN